MHFLQVTRTRWGKDPDWAPPPGNLAFKVSPPPGQPNHFISVLDTSFYQLFFKNRRGKWWFLQHCPFLSDSSSRQFPKEPLLEPSCVGWMVKEKVFSKSHWYFTKMPKMILFCNLPLPWPTHSDTYQILTHLLTSFYSQIFIKYIYNSVLAI